MMASDEDEDAAVQSALFWSKCFPAVWWKAWSEAAMYLKQLNVKPNLSVTHQTEAFDQIDISAFSDFLSS